MSTTQNQITGVIRHVESGRGLPGINVLIQYFSAGTKLPTINKLPGDSAAFWNGFPGASLGSVVSDSNGGFEFSYQDSDLSGIPEGSRPGIILLAIGPEKQGTHLHPNIVHLSTPVFQAGREESYVIELTTSQLRSVDIRLPDEAIDIVDVYSHRIQQEEQVQTQLRNLWQGKVSTEKVLMENRWDQYMPGFLQSVSKVSKDLKDSGTFIEEGTDIEETARQVRNSKINSAINGNNLNQAAKIPFQGFLRLGEDEKILLAPFMDGNGDYVNVPADLAETILYKKERDNKAPLSLAREKEVNRSKMEQSTTEQDSEIALDIVDGQAADPPQEPSGNGVEVINYGDIPQYISRVVDPMAAPEEEVVFGLTPSNREDIQENVDQFSLDSGPADAPMYVDFHHIQIAFDDVWTELLDDDVVDMAEELYNEMAEMGGNPRQPSADDPEARNLPPIKLLRKELKHIRGAYKKANYSRRRAASIDGPNGIRRNSGGTGIKHLLQNGIGQTHLPEADVVMTDDGAYSANMYASPPENETQHKRRRQREDETEPHPQNQGTSRPGSSLPPPRGNPSRNTGNNEDDRYTQLHTILQQLEERLREPYSFTVFAANGQERSVNFGIVSTYRQKWTPIKYQVGELVKTIPLAPGEMKKFSKKTVLKKKRSIKELEKSSSMLRDESSTTTKAEAEIMRRAQAKTSFNLNVEGSFDFILSDGKVSSSLGHEAEKTSSEIKKQFRESVIKAIQEYKNERSQEIVTEESFSSEMTESGELKNTNSEITVTYLMYELQRRYRVTEELHRLTPIVLIANEVPNPAEIDEDWLIAHDWIINRSLLDDSFRSALQYLSNQIAGDEVGLEEVRKNIAQQRRIVDRLKAELRGLERLTTSRYRAMEQQINNKLYQSEQEGDGFLEDVWEFFGGNGGGEESSELAEARVLAAREAYDEALAKEKERSVRMDRELKELNALTLAYSKQLSQHVNRKVQVARLKVHVKQNILYYMQAIWSHEPSDQRFFRLHQVQVPIYEYQTKAYDIKGQSEIFIDGRLNTQNSNHRFTVRPSIDTNGQTYKSLVEMADLDNLLGFKGNYMMFPLKENNAITELMMAPYVDAELGLHDPDQFGNMTRHDFAEYVLHLKETLSEQEFDKLKSQLVEQYQQLLMAPLRSGEDVIIPSDSLFIECLPGTRSNLEPFKLMHRAIDVKKVQAEVRDMELENLRSAARLLNDNLDDPDVESVKHIHLNGTSETQTVMDITNQN
ncbi:MAG: hypothetical protein AAF587_06095 [Bacteroidota bacterium]